MIVDHAHSPQFLPALRRRTARLALSRALGVGLALSVFGTFPPSVQAAKKVAKPAHASMRCELWAVHASKRKAKQRIPADLSSLRPELSDDQFAAFSSFRLLERKNLSSRMNHSSEQSFRAGYQMKLRLVQTQGNRLKVRVQLNRGPSSGLVNLDYWMNSGSLLMLVGGNYEDGKIVFATRCRASSR